MANGEANQSAGREFIQSAGRELDAAPPPDFLTAQQLVQSRNWTGCGALWLPPYYGESTPAGPWLPSVAWRTAYRKRWGNLHAIFTSDPESYEGDHTTNGGGMCPVIDSIPILIDFTPPDTVNLPYGSWAYADHSSQLLEHWNYKFAALRSITYGIGPYFHILTDFSGDASTATASRAIDGDYPAEDISLELTSETAFASLLANLKTALYLRAWPDFDPGEYFEWQRMKDARGYSPSIDPDVMDGSADTAFAEAQTTPDTERCMMDPYFGADYATYADGRSLWSGWYYAGNEQNDTYRSTDAGVLHDQDLIWSKRTRFKTTSGASYFIAQGILTHPPGDYGTQLDDNQKLIGVKVVGSYTAGSDWIEILWPDTTTSGDTDFADVVLKSGGTNSIPAGTHTLSFGCIRFVIVGETAAQWSARTGIAYS